MAIRVHRLSKEYIRIPVSATEAGAPVDPTADALALAFMASGVPAAPDWKAGTWETDATVTPAVYYARCTVGGTGTGATAELAVGSYSIYVRVTSAAETPVMANIERLEIF